jgi:enoyl-CoA hydratase/carnithine racemase
MSKDKEYEHIYVEKVSEGNYAVISMNRPQRLNALNTITVREISEALDAMVFDKKIRCVVLRGTKNFTKKPAFSAGADLAGQKPPKGFKMSIPAHGALANYDMHKYVNMIEEFPKPLLAAVDGYALGGGCEVSLACDLVIATRRSQFGFPEIHRGIFPGAGGTQRMARRIGVNRALEMCYYGEHYSAETMHQWGHVNFLCNDGDEFEKLIDEKARRLASLPTTSLLVIKQCVKFGTQVPTNIGLMFERLGFGVNAGSSDVMEGISAFLQKREPKFTGGM